MYFDKQADLARVYEKIKLFVDIGKALSDDGPWSAVQTAKEKISSTKWTGSSPT